mgnify:CR=1 FL=1
MKLWHVAAAAAIFAAVFSMRFNGDSVLWVISVASRAPVMSSPARRTATLAFTATSAWIRSTLS